MAKLPMLLSVLIGILFPALVNAQAAPPTISLSNTGTQFICNTGKDTLYYSLSATNVPPNTNVVIYQGADSTFNPYMGQGDSIGFVPGQALPLDTLNFGTCVKIIGEFIDACGPSGQEGRNEYIVLTSGNGFRVNNLAIDFSSQNNSGNANHDININATPCTFKTPTPSLIAGLQTGSCNASNVIPASPGDSIPPNAIVVVFTSDSVSANYSLNGLCNQGYPVYILQSACVRTIGAFTNAPRCDAPSRYRTTFAIDLGKNCSDGFTYDLCGIFDEDGTFAIRQAGIDTASVANNGIRRNTIDSCGGIDYTQLSFSSDTILKYPLQNPNVVCNTTYYLKAVTHPNGSQPVSNYIPFQLVCVDVNAAARVNTICSGETADISISSTTPNATFSWTVSGGANISGESAGSGSSINQTLVNTGNAADSITYHIQSLSNGCTATQNVTIRVNKCASDTLYICSGDTVQLDGESGHVSYSWTPANTLNNAGIEDPLAFPTTTTTYVVTYGDTVNIITNGGFENGLTGWSTDYALYTNQNPPFGTYSIDVSAQNIYFGYCANPDVTPNGDKYLIVDGSTSSTPRILYRTLPVDQNTDYVFEFWAMPISSHVNVPRFDVKFNGAVLIDDLTLDTTTCMWKKYTFNWNSAANTSLNLEIIDVRATGQGNDFAMDEIALKRPAASKDSVVVIVDTKPAPAINGNLLVCNGAQTTLTVTGQYDSVRWNTNATTTSINVTQGGTYTVTAYNGRCSGSASVQVTAATASVSITGGLQVCTGSTTTLTASGQFDSLRWNNNQTSTSITVGQGGTYSVTAYNDGCSASATVTVNFRVCTDTVYICSGDTIQLDGPSGYSSYSWTPVTGLSNPNIEDPLAFPTVTTTYVVTDGDTVNIITNGDFENGLTGWSTDYALYTNQNPPFGTYSIDVSAQNIYFGYCANPDVTPNGDKYLIVDGSTSSTPRILYRTIPVDQNTDYVFEFWAMPISSHVNVPRFDVKFNGAVLIDDLTLDTTTCLWKKYTFNWNSAANTSLNLEIIDVRATGQGNDFAMDEIALKKAGSQSDTIVVVVDTKPTPDILGNQSFCTGGQTVLTVVGQYDSVRWNTNETTTSITVTQAGTYTVTAYNGRCSGTASVQVTTSGTTVQITGNLNICSGGTTTLTAAGQFDSVRWNTNETTSSITVSQAGQYTVTAYFNGCPGTASATVTLQTAPQPFSLGNDTTYCGNFSRILSAGDQTTVWSTGATAAQITVTQPAAYIATISNTCGTVSDTIVISQNPLPVINIGDDTTYCEGQIELTANGQFRSIVWSTGAQTASIIVTAPGTYNVTVTDGNNCSDSDAVVITLDCDNTLFIPNAFSPNGDNVNDVFYVRGNAANLTIQKMIIYDRWGEKLFEADNVLPDDPARGWNGTYKDKPVQKDVYGYLVVAKYADGEEVNYQGNVTLLK